MVRGAHCTSVCRKPCWTVSSMRCTRRYPVGSAFVASPALRVEDTVVWGADRHHSAASPTGTSSSGCRPGCDGQDLFQAATAAKPRALSSLYTCRAEQG